jgi:hypothetical protein
MEAPIFNPHHYIPGPELVKRSGLHYTTLWRYRRAGKLPFVEMFGRIFFKRKPAEEWLASIGKA